MIAIMDYYTINMMNTFCGGIPAGQYILILLMLFPLFSCRYPDQNLTDKKAAVSEKSNFRQSQGFSGEQEFVKEGELVFLGKNAGEKITKIDIEIADNPYEWGRGLMYRHSMPEAAGMLFIFPRPQLLSFWMRNTYLPLDIIFVDGSMRIVTMHKNTRSLSEKPLFSNVAVKYAVEVNAGFCDRYGIKKGDHIRF
jgi:uncharacterized membrane protein (UPF0127 family)